MATSLTLEGLANLNRELSNKITLEIIDLKNALDEAVRTKVVFGMPDREWAVGSWLSSLLDKRSILYYIYRDDFNHSLPEGDT